MDREETPVPLPSAASVKISPNITIQPPLTRRGHGPGLVLLVPETITLVEGSHSLDPAPLQKWAEEGYAVLEIRVPGSVTGYDIASDLKLGIDSLESLTECDKKGDYGCIVYTEGLDPKITSVIDNSDCISCIISYDISLSIKSKPLLRQQSGKLVPPKATGAGNTTYHYPEAASGFFIIPRHKDFLPAPATVAHTRCLTFLKKIMGAPFFDLEAIWEEHTEYEFGNRSVANTMGTMVQEPYVNHITTMTGGIGRQQLTNFYAHHFIWSNPEGTALELVSRTVGIDRIVEEFIFTTNHNKTIDWLVPGIPPTGKDLRIPMTGVVNIRGDRLYHEHIAWDQATVLVQLGLMPEYLPFPYDLPGGKKPAAGKRFEYRVPAAGVETALKLVDETAVPSNTMFEFALREVDDV